MKICSSESWTPLSVDIRRTSGVVAVVWVTFCPSGINFRSLNASRQRNSGAGCLVEGCSSLDIVGRGAADAPASWIVNEISIVVEATCGTDGRTDGRPASAAASAVVASVDGSVVSWFRRPSSLYSTDIRPAAQWPAVLHARWPSNRRTLASDERSHVTDLNYSLI